MMMLACVAAVVVGQQVFEPTAKDQGIRVERDYCAEFVALAPRVEEGERAWPVYLQAYRALGWPPDEMNLEPGNEGWPVLRAYVAAHPEGVELLRRAAGMKVLGYPLAADCDPALTAAYNAVRPDEVEEFQPVAFDGDPRVHDLQFAHYGTLRRFIRTLRIDARTAIEQGDGARLEADIVAIVGIADHGCEYPELAGETISCAGTIAAIEIVGRALKERPDLLSDASLKRLSELFTGAPMQGRVRPRMEWFRHAVLDVLQRGYSDDGEGDGKLKPQGIKELDLLAGTPGKLERMISEKPRLALALFTGAARRKQVMEEFERIVAPANWHMPLWEMERWPEVKPSTEEGAVGWSTKYLVLGMIMPDLSEIARKSERALQWRDAVRMALALELMRRETGAFPERLEELAPRYLDEVGRDRFTGEALKYKVVEGRAVVYSCGPDLDDDGGKGVEEAGEVEEWAPPRAKERDGVVDGDWVLVEVGF